MDLTDLAILPSKLIHKWNDGFVEISQAVEKITEFVFLIEKKNQVLLLASLRWSEQFFPATLIGHSWSQGFWLLSCYRPQRSWGTVIFSEACVKNSVPRRVGLPHCMLGYPPGADIPPGADTPQTVHAGRYGQQAGGTYPTGMHTCWK